MEKECRDKGSQWSSVIFFNAVIMLAVFLNMCCAGFGGIMPLCRLVGAYFASLLCLGHLAVIVITAVYRYNSMGMLCALSSSPTKISSTSIDDEWTYQTDGRLMIFCFIIQLLTFVLFCMQGVCNIRPHNDAVPKVPYTTVDETNKDSQQDIS